MVSDLFDEDTKMLKISTLNKMNTFSSKFGSKPKFRL